MRAVDLLGPNGPLARAIEGYEHRPQQLEMAETVEHALSEGGIALVEAGTGTGKTLAYLVPALLSGKRVVISTGTKTLQDQIMQRDLPLLESYLGIPVNAALMKGLNNYLCLRRYEEFVHSPEADLPQFAKHLPLLREFRAGSHSGERSDFNSVPEDAPIWGQVHSSSETRIGQRCGHFDRCFVTKMRRAAEEAQIIVVNHHLFFADLALRDAPQGGGAIPDYDAVIFDEAHQIEDVVTEFFGVRLSTARIETLVRDAERAFRAAKLFESKEPLGRAVLTAASQFFSSLPRGRENEAGRRTLSVQSLAANAREHVFGLDAALEALETDAKLSAPASEAVAQVARRTRRARDDLNVIFEGKQRHVTWAETRGRSTSVGASPVEVGELLRERIFERGGAAVLTSATLSTAGDFSFVKRRIGIDFEVDELSLPSPFDYGMQAALYIPREIPEPRDPRFLEAATKEILDLIELTGGGAFVLCTSLRMMRELHAACAPKLHRPPLVQGMAPKTELLDTFKAQGDAVLFASASFWEGVDVPGSALRLVVIDKLPFDVPTDPLVEARCKLMEERGENAFMGYLVPQAALSLKQGFGRLIRTQSDRGIVAVLDRRLSSKGYGRVFLKSLPEASRCYSLSEVRAFWEDPT
ncbi:MAG: ATP-dependent DNA helicase [Myxococcales bacterium]